MNSWNDYFNGGKSLYDFNAADINIINRQAGSFEFGDGNYERKIAFDSQIGREAAKVEASLIRAKEYDSLVENRSQNFLMSIHSSGDGRVSGKIILGNSFEILDAVQIGDSVFFRLRIYGRFNNYCDLSYMQKEQLYDRQWLKNLVNEVATVEDFSAYSKNSLDKIANIILTKISDYPISEFVKGTGWFKDASGNLKFYDGTRFSLSPGLPSFAYYSLPKVDLTFEEAIRHLKKCMVEEYTCSVGKMAALICISLLGPLERFCESYRLPAIFCSGPPSRSREVISRIFSLYEERDTDCWPICCNDGESVKSVCGVRDEFVILSDYGERKNAKKLRACCTYRCVGGKTVRAPIIVESDIFSDSLAEDILFDLRNVFVSEKTSKAIKSVKLRVIDVISSNPVLLSLLKKHIGEAHDLVTLMLKFTDWLENFSGVLNEKQSGWLFAGIEYVSDMEAAKTSALIEKFRQRLSEYLTGNPEEIIKAEDITSEAQVFNMIIRKKNYFYFTTKFFARIMYEIGIDAKLILTLKKDLAARGILGSYSGDGGYAVDLWIPKLQKKFSAYAFIHNFFYI